MTLEQAIASSQRMFTVDQAVEMLRALGPFPGRTAFYEAIKRDQVRAVRIGRRVLIPLSEIKRLAGEDP